MGKSDLGGRKGDRESRALVCRLAALRGEGGGCSDFRGLPVSTLYFINFCIPEMNIFLLRGKSKIMLDVFCGGDKAELVVTACDFSPNSPEEVVSSPKTSSPIKGWWHHKQIATKGFMVDSSQEHVCEHK